MNMNRGAADTVSAHKNTLICSEEKFNHKESPQTAAVNSLGVLGAHQRGAQRPLRLFWFLSWTPSRGALAVNGAVLQIQLTPRIVVSLSTLSLQHLARRPRCVRVYVRL